MVDDAFTRNEKIAGIIIASIIIGVIAAVGWAIVTHKDPIYTHEGKLVDVETSAGGFGRNSKTTLYFEDGTVFVFDLIEKVLVLQENYLVRYYNSPFRLASIEMI